MNEDPSKAEYYTVDDFLFMLLISIFTYQLESDLKKYRIYFLMPIFSFFIMLSFRVMGYHDDNDEESSKT